MRDIAVIIPTHSPDGNMFDFVHKLVQKDAAQIIIVNDQGNKEFDVIFSELAKLNNCIVIPYKQSMGNGSALKMAFQYCLTNFGNLNGVITVDADGPYSVEDVLEVAKVLQNYSEGIVLGARAISDTRVSFLSKIGKQMTSLAFHSIYGQRIQDALTQLRGISMKVVPELLKLKGERFDYELNMLIFAKRANVPIREVEVHSPYEANSRYRPVRDSFGIFTMLFTGLIKYSFVTLLSGIIDITSFIILVSIFLQGLPIELRILIATALARILSSSLNFHMNRKIVFQSENQLKESLLRYYMLFTGLIMASYLLVTSTTIYLGVNVILAKICIDAMLGIASFNLQLNWVFKKKKGSHIGILSKLFK